MNKANDIVCVNKRNYPTQRGEDDWEVNGPATVVVLVAGSIGDYAAYCGHGTPEWVARHGDKLSFEEARVHFPIGLEEARYRG